MLFKTNNGTPTQKYSSKELRSDNPRTMFPRDLANTNLSQFNAVWVPAGTRPDITSVQKATLPELPTLDDNGTYTYAYVVEDRDEPTGNEVNNERTKRIEGGTSFAVAGLTSNVILQGRPFDQTVYLALLTRATGFKAAGETNSVLTVRGKDDVVHTLTPDQMISLVSQAMTWFEDVMKVSWAMKDNTGSFTAGVPLDFDSNDSYWP